ncbi:MAG: hypothetical protein FWC43_08915, partial [Planctomycetaceae bacterium]|nr:hypothetical protein [Planctomycetaceae bacterium]
MIRRKTKPFFFSVARVRSFVSLVVVAHDLLLVYEAGKTASLVVLYLLASRWNEKTDAPRGLHGPAYPAHPHSCPFPFLVVGIRFAFRFYACSLPPAVCRLPSVVCSLPP